MKRTLLTIKKFWNAVKPLLPEKVKSKEKVTLVENAKNYYARHQYS